MQLITVIFLAIAFTYSMGDKLDEANSYLDEVLADYLPSAIEDAGLIRYELPNFSHNHQNRTSDGAVLNSKILYWAGNLTGLQDVLRERCEEPSWSSGNVTVVCDIVLPHLQVEYMGRFQSIKGLDNPFSVHIRQFDFNIDLDAREVKAKLEVTSSPRIQVPSIRQLSIVSRGNISVKQHTEATLEEDVTGGLKHRYNDLFDDIFYGPFKNALAAAIGSVRYPRSE